MLNVTARRSLVKTAGRSSSLLNEHLRQSCAYRQSLLLANLGRAFSVTSGAFREETEAEARAATSAKASSPVKRKVARSSLARVAAEAERSRDASKSGRREQPREHEVGVKVVTAYAAAEEYDITKVARILTDVGYQLDPYDTKLEGVVHFQHGGGDIFVFPSGTLVAWDVPEDVVHTFLTRGLIPAARAPYRKDFETEDLEYVEDESDKSTIVNERIRLGIGSPTEGTSGSSDFDNSVEHNVTGTTLAKVAFSSGLARSVKLAVLETALNRYLESTQNIPTTLSAGSKLPFTRSFLLRKTGELLNVRAQLNLYSELTDSLPDLFWDSRHELGLEGYFDRVGRALDVNIRIKTLNEKMDYAQEIATVLRERLSEKHGLLLEWLIIALISVEAGLALLHLWEAHDPASTENLLREYLRRELRDKN